MTKKEAGSIKGPDLMHGATEGMRTGMEFFRSATHETLPSLICGVRGQSQAQGSPILVIQGFAMHDLTTWTMRRHLDDLGHDSFDANIGFNLGVRDHYIERMEQRLEEIASRHPGEKITIIGHSLGGIQGLLLSYRHPELVDRLVTMGSPFSAAQLKGGTNRLVYEAYEMLNPDDDALVKELNDHIAQGYPKAAVTSIFSQADGVVAPQAAMNPWAEKKGAKAENIEVDGSHCGMIVNLDVWTIVADRLVASPQNWRAFDWDNIKQQAEPSLELLPA